MSGKKKGLFKIKPFKDYKYGDVLELKAMVVQSQGIDLSIIKKVARLSGNKIGELKIMTSKVSKYFATINQIEEQFLEIKKYEGLLSTNADDKLINAGSEQLNQFGDLNTIDALAGGDILKWEMILKLDWWDVFNKLYKTKIENDIRINLELQRDKK